MIYGDIQNDFTALLNRRDCTTAQRNAFFNEAIQRIQREVRCPAMEKSVIYTVPSNYSGLTIPSDLLELISILPEACDDRLEKTSIERALKGAREPGAPKFYCRQGGVWVLAPAPQQADVIRVDYYAELGTLSAPTDEVPLTKIAPDLLKYAALSYAGDFFNDKRTPTWETRYTQIRDSLQNMADADETSGASVVTPAYSYPEDC